MAKGFVYVVAMIEWYSRKVLAWRVSNTLVADFCVEALEEAISLYGTSDIFNMEEGAQFTSEAFTGVLKAASIRISMDGKGRCLDYVFVERLCRILKYEEVYPRRTGRLPRLGRYWKLLPVLKRERRHQRLDRQTPDQVYEGSVLWPVAA